MSKFNLKNYKKTDGDLHIDKKLQEQHGNIPNTINEDQLEDYRSTEHNDLTEKLLEKARTGEISEVAERRLDNSKSNFNIKYRNSDAYSGDINKVEEQRLANDPVEKEKYELASETPKKLRWWENVKSPDGLKLAESKKKVKVAQEDGLEDILEQLGEGEEDFDVNDVQEDELHEVEKTKEDVVIDTFEEAKNLPEIRETITERPSDEETKSMKVMKQKDLKGKIPGVYMVLAYNPKDFQGDAFEIKKSALAKVLDVRPELGGLINIDDFGDIKETEVTGQVSLRAGGDKFFAIFSQDKNIAQPLNKDENLDIIDPNTTEPEQDYFKEVSYEEKDIDGTPMAIGKIKVDYVIEEDDREDTIEDALMFIQTEHIDLNITRESLDLSKLDNNEIGFMVAVPPKEEDMEDFPVTEIERG
jgi:hypothetical protein